MTALDLSVSFPSRGVIRLQSRALFGDAANPECRRFVLRVLQAAEITGVSIRGGPSPHADLTFRPRRSRLDQVVERVVALLRTPEEDAGTTTADGPAPPRHRDGLAGAWQMRPAPPGHLRLKNRWLVRRSAACRAVERELMGVLGIEHARASALSGTVRVAFDPAQLEPSEILEVLGSVVDDLDITRPADPIDLHLPLCTASVPIAAAAHFAAPALLPVAAAVFAVTSIPILRKACRSLFRERRLGADVLDSVVVVGCLGTMSIFPGAVLCWCLGAGRALAHRTQDSSRKLMLDAFGQRPRRARLLRDGAEVLVPAGRLRRGDIVVVDAGEVLPVDGRIVAGMVMIDPSALAGESSPAEKGVGDRVLASTIALGGRAYIRVEAAGRGTTSARIGRILEASAAESISGSPGTRPMDDRAAVPALALGAVGLATVGPVGAVALLHRDLGSGLRLSAPLARLGALALCIHRGILIRDARALDRMAEVDAVVLAGLDPQVADFEDLHDLGITTVPGGDDPSGCVQRLQREGRTVALVGDAAATTSADVTISLGGLESIDDEAAQAILLDGRLDSLADLRRIARDLRRNLRRGGGLLVVPNVACVAGIFTMGFGIMASVLAGNLAALAALGNAVLPLREVAQLEAERRHRLEFARAVAAARLPGAVDADAELVTPDRAVYDEEESLDAVPARRGRVGADIPRS